MSGELNFEAMPFEAYETFAPEQSGFELEEEFGRRAPRGRPGFSPRPRPVLPKRGAKPPAFGWGRPKKPPVRPPRFPPFRPRWPGGAAGPYAAVPEPYGVAPEPPSAGSEYMRWVQSALNDVLGLRLPVNGIADPATRSAIGNFQQRNGLPADGVVGPDTERALIAARRGKAFPGGATSPMGPEPSEPAFSEPGATQSMEPAPAPAGAEGELSPLARPCGCPSCRRGEPCPCKSQKEDLMTSMRDIQPEAFEFQPEFSFGEFDSRPAKRGVYETELELEDEYTEEPFPLPKWPPSRIFNPPPPQTIPAGPFRTFSPCDAILRDFEKLSLAVGELKKQLRQSPPDRGLVTNRSNVVRALSRQIVARLQKLEYSKQGCTREDMKAFASSVNATRGGGADADVGSWPPARSATVQEPRKAARESLRHLLNWIRRAERNFPRIQPEMSFGEFGYESDFEGEAPMGEFEWGAHEFEVAIPRTIHRLDCAAGCPGGLTEAQCAPLVSRAIIQAIKLANNAASKLEALIKIEPSKRDNDAKETARLFRAFFGDDPLKPISGEPSGVSIAKRFRAVAKELSPAGRRRIVFRCLPTRIPCADADLTCCTEDDQAWNAQADLPNVVALCALFWAPGIALRGLPIETYRGGVILHETLHILYGPHTRGGFLVDVGRRANAHCHRAFALRVARFGQDLVTRTQCPPL
jgi:Putative peptidoglycan binding domain